jgi:hypothetical protein
MKVVELKDVLEQLVVAGYGNAPVFKASDDEGNEFTFVSEALLTTAEEMENSDIWIEDPRPDDEDHVVLW